MALTLTLCQEVFSVCVIVLPKNRQNSVLDPKCQKYGYSGPNPSKDFIVQVLVIRFKYGHYCINDLLLKIVKIVFFGPNG